MKTETIKFRQGFVKIIQLAQKEANRTVKTQVIGLTEQGKYRIDPKREVSWLPNQICEVMPEIKTVDE